MEATKKFFTIDDEAKYDNKADSFNIWGEVYFSCLVSYKNELIKVYAIGAFGWVWS